MKKKFKQFIKSIFLSKRGWGWLVSLITKTVFLFSLFKKMENINLYIVLLYAVMEIAYMMIVDKLKFNDIDVDVNYGK